MSKNEQKITVEQPKPQSQPKESESPKRLRLVELETRVAPSAIWGD